MTVETASYISQLDTTLPTAADLISEGDDHIRLTKTVLKTQFPNFGATAIAASAAEVNYSVGVTSAIQTQLNGKGAIGGQAWTGAHSFAGATSVPTLAAGTNTTGAASTAFVQADFLQKFPNYTAPVTASTTELNYLVGLTGAIQPQLSNQVAGPTHAATAKTTPDDTDELGYLNSAAGFALVKMTWANLKTWLGGLYVSKSGDTMAGGLTVPSLNGGQLAGLRNKIINGNFDIWQRGTSLTISSAFSGGAFIADRFLSAADAGSSGSFTVSRQAFTPGQTDVPYEPAYFYRMATSSFTNGTDGFTYLAQQRVEDVRTFAGQTVTLSFYARASAAATIGVSMNQTFGSGGSGSVKFGSQTLALTTSFKKFTLTFSAPSITGKTIGSSSYLALEIFAALRGTTATAYGVTAFTAIASGSYDLAQVQLEVGPVATPFEHRPYGMELALCQRYLPAINGGGGYIGTGLSTNATLGYAVVAHSVQPRVAPTGIVISDPTHFTSVNAAGSSVSCTSLTYNSGGLAQSAVQIGAASGLTPGGPLLLAITNGAGQILFTGCEL